jgi:putative ABC transport system permease protein
MLTLRPAGNIRYISPGYFQALGIRLTRGRAITEADRNKLVIVVNERTAAALWPGQNPIGKRMHQGDEEKPLLEVVGTVADTREVALQREPLLMGYVPYFGRRVPQSATLVLRTTADPATVAEPIRRAMRRVDPTLPSPEIRSLRQAADAAVAPERFQMLLIGVFASGALLLAALGIYGVPAYTVARRRRELGLRLALGAQPSELLRMVIRQGLTPVGIGLLGGLAGALAAGRFVASLLFDVTPYDPPTLAAVALLVGVVALVACYIPARRATRIASGTRGRTGSASAIMPRKTNGKSCCSGGQSVPRKLARAMASTRRPCPARRSASAAMAAESAADRWQRSAMASGAPFAATTNSSRRVAFQPWLMASMSRLSG